jgi:hypothetical protein
LEKFPHKVYFPKRLPSVFGKHVKFEKVYTIALNLYLRSNKLSLIAKCTGAPKDKAHPPG